MRASIISMNVTHRTTVLHTEGLHNKDKTELFFEKLLKVVSNELCGGALSRCSATNAILYSVIIKYQL